MKKGIAIAIAVWMSSAAFAQKANERDGMKDKDSTTYCLEVKDGLPVLMQGDEQVFTDVTLKNGTQIKTDGTVIKKNGDQMVLKTNECVNVKGDIVRSKNTARAGNARKN